MVKSVWFYVVFCLTIFLVESKSIRGGSKRLYATGINLHKYKSNFEEVGFEMGEKARFHMQKGVKLMNDLVPGGNARHKITFAVQQRNLDRLTDLLLDVSTPSSVNFGKHWTRTEVMDFTSNPKSADTLVNFLRVHEIEITHETHYRDYVTATASIAQWEIFFKTKFHTFHDEVHDKFFVRALEHSVPKPLKSHIMGVFGVSDYFLDHNSRAKGGGSMKVRREMKKRAENVVSTGNSEPTATGQPWCENALDDDNGDILFTVCVAYPQLLYAYYNVSNPVGSELASQAVFASLDQSFSPDDLNQFQTYFNLTVQPIAGAYNGHVYYNACYVDTDNCDEASLDTQYITSMAQGVPTYFDYVAEGSENLFVEWIIEVANMTNPADVYSISYGGVELYRSDSTLTTFNTEAQRLGLSGVTIVCSSGDNGVAGSTAQDDPSECSYAPSFPSVSPYVTSVGATQVRLFSFCILCFACSNIRFFVN